MLPPMIDHNPISDISIVPQTRAVSSARQESCAVQPPPRLVVPVAPSGSSECRPLGSKVLAALGGPTSPPVCVTQVILPPGIDMHHTAWAVLLLMERYVV
jgi:hypothetical protein